MKRVVVVFVGIVVLGLAPAFASAMGLMPSGLPSMGNFFGGPASCGGDFGPRMPGPTFYVGWGTTDRPIGLSASTEGIPLLNITDINHRYGMNGVWLGLSQAFVLSDNFAVLGSAWYLIPQSGSNQVSRETYNNGFAGRTWSSTRNEWWYVDGLLALSCGRGGSFLAGLRYDYFTTQFRDPERTVNVFSLPSDRANLTAYNVIPLVGVQWASQSSVSNLTLRAVGIPTLVGNVKYTQPFSGTNSIESSGTWRRGYFFEVFLEASRSFSGGGPKIGFFARWNTTHGDVDLDIDSQGAQLPVLVNETFHSGFTRNTWTVGGNFQLDFAMPWSY